MEKAEFIRRARTKQGKRKLVEQDGKLYWSKPVNLGLGRQSEALAELKIPRQFHLSLGALTFVEQRHKDRSLSIREVLAAADWEAIARTDSNAPEGARLITAYLTWDSVKKLEQGMDRLGAHGNQALELAIRAFSIQQSRTEDPAEADTSPPPIPTGSRQGYRLSKAEPSGKKA